MLYGVDVHDGYQAGLSFPTLKRQGYTFAAVKLTQGTGYVRDQADEWVRAAAAAGLIPGGYHWLNSEPGAAQAKWFYRKVRECGGPQGMLIQCDNEDNATVQVTRDWAAEWAQLSGGHPFLMYTGGWWWPAHLGSFRGVDLTPYLWHSRYAVADTDAVPDDPAAIVAKIPASWWVPGYGGWAQATILQFTSQGDAGGLANKVDLNATRLTLDQLRALAGLTAAPPEEDDMAMYVIEVGGVPPTQANPKGERVVASTGTEWWWVRDFAPLAAMGIPFPTHRVSPQQLRDAFGVDKEAATGGGPAVLVPHDHEVPAGSTGPAQPA